MRVFDSAPSQASVPPKWQWKAVVDVDLTYAVARYIVLRYSAELYMTPDIHC